VGGFLGYTAVDRDERPFHRRATVDSSSSQPMATTTRHYKTANTLVHFIITSPNPVSSAMCQSTAVDAISEMCVLSKSLKDGRDCR
jgi:hypothetical protein